MYSTFWLAWLWLFFFVVPKKMNGHTLKFQGNRINTGNGSWWVANGTALTARGAALWHWYRPTLALRPNSRAAWRRASHREHSASCHSMYSHFLFIYYLFIYLLLPLMCAATAAVINWRKKLRQKRKGEKIKQMRNVRKIREQYNFCSVGHPWNDDNLTESAPALNLVLFGVGTHFWTNNNSVFKAGDN